MTHDTPCHRQDDRFLYSSFLFAPSFSPFLFFSRLLLSFLFLLLPVSLPFFLPGEEEA